MIRIAGQEYDSATATWHRNQHIVPEAAPLELGSWPPLFRHVTDHVACSKQVTGIGSDDPVRLESVDEALSNRSWFSTPMRPEE